MRSGHSGPMTAAEQDVGLTEPLLLPDVVELPIGPDGWPRFGSSGNYGAADVAAAYCGFKTVPEHLRGYWQHGWTASYRMPIPPDLILGTWPKQDEYYWVARKDEEQHLRSAGLPHVAAIGMPLIYLPPRPIRRRQNSLLVMPAHNLDYVTCSWKFDEYAEAIAAIRHEFSDVVVCISPPCWKHGYWVDAFRKRGFHLIKGAKHSDRNALERSTLPPERFRVHGDELLWLSPRVCLLLRRETVRLRPVCNPSGGGFRQRSRDSAQPQASAGDAQIVLRRRAAPQPSSIVLPPRRCAGRRRVGPR